MWYVKAIVALAVVTIIGMGAMHYQGILSDLQAANDALTLEQVRSASFEESRDVWKNQAESVTRAMEGLADNAAEAEIEVEKLRDVQEKHDIGKLAAGRPGMVERRINSGTAHVFGLFYDVTAGSGDNIDASSSGIPAAPAAD